MVSKVKTSITAALLAALVLPMVFTASASAACLSTTTSSKPKEVRIGGEQDAAIIVKTTMRYTKCTKKTTIQFVTVSTKQGYIHGSKSWTCKRAGVNSVVFAASGQGAVSKTCTKKTFGKQYYGIVDFLYGNKPVKRGACINVSGNMDIREPFNDGKADDQAFNVGTVCAK